MNKKRIQILLVFSILSIFSTRIESQEKILTAEDMKKDLNQLITILETSHPDPYINSGGKIEFHRKYQKLLASIPENGHTNCEFYYLILPFIA